MVLRAGGRVALTGTQKDFDELVAKRPHLATEDMLFSRIRQGEAEICRNEILV